MSADFEKVLVKDPRLDVVDSIKYAVVKGGQNVTASPFRAISESDSQVIWNIQVPSEQTIVDRRVLWQSTLIINVTTAGTGIYGVTWALASFPLHQLISVMQATINNNTVSLNVTEALPIITRMLSCEDLTWFNSTSPTFADTQNKYNTATTLVDHNNPLSSLWGCEFGKNPHRGCFAPSNIAAGVAEGTLDITFQLAEPLLISPFIFSDLKANSQGFYGIQNMNFVLNKNGFQKRVARGNVSINSVSTSGGAGNSAPTSSLLFMFLTPHPSDLMPARNIVPFYELPRYITSFPSATLSAKLSNGALTYGPNSTSIDLNTLQLNQIPDKLLIYVRKLLANNTTDPDVALPIGKISINFNNNSGILASANPVQLWQMSRDNGLNNSWVEYSGYGTTSTSGSDLVLVGTVGSYLCLEFGKDIQLTEDFYAAGSLGNFNLQVRLTEIYNNTYADITANSYQVVMITMNSGVFVNERGTSSTYTGILTKQDVLEASQQDHYTHNDVGRMVGGFDIFGALKSGLSGVAKMGKKAAMKHGKKLLKSGTEMASSALDKYLK